MGRVERGQVKTGQSVVLCHNDGTTKQARITKMYQFEGLKRVEAQSAALGDLIAVSGITGSEYRRDCRDPECVEPRPL